MNTNQLPKAVQELLENNKKQATDHQELIRSGGYLPPSEELLVDAIVALSMGKNILLKGPTGAGKTKFAETLSSLFERPMYSVNCSVDLDAESLMGFKTLAYEEEKQTIQFVPGPVTNAMKQGSFLYIDEINMAKPETLPLINGVLDYRRTITNPFTNEIVTAAEGFGVIAAINEGYIGTVPLNEALKNRFIVIDVPYIQGEQLEQLINDSTNLTDKQLISHFVTLSNDLITAVSQGKVWHHAKLRGEIHNKTIAVLGVGKIGQETAKIAKAFGMKVLGVRHSGKAAEYVDEMYQPHQLDSVLPQSDYVVVTLPLTEDTHHLIGEEQFKQMKKNVFFVNIGRGPIVDEKALIAALQNNEIAGAGMDVFENEPLDHTSPLWDMENVILTPHTAGATEFYNQRVIEDIFIPNLKSYLNGEAPAINLYQHERGY